MDSILISAILAFFGLCFGSFAGAQVWRLRARQLVEDKAEGEDYDKNEYRALLPLTQHKTTDDRSQCLHCGHRLAWYDLLPLMSWLGTGGKCRYCHKRIGNFEPLIELGVAVFFVVSFLFWLQSLTAPLEIIQFIIWLIAGVMLTILLAYDAKWFLLPDRVVFPLTALAALYAGIELTQVGNGNVFLAILSLAAAAFILSGIYLMLWIVSKGKWIGFGDIKLGLILALLLGRWELALLALFLANLVGCVIVLPGLATKKLSRTTQIPFGPMLIIGFVIAMLFGDGIIDWYLSATSTLML